jgi:hypothetical protein
LASLPGAELDQFLNKTSRIVSLRCGKMHTHFSAAQAMGECPGYAGAFSSRLKAQFKQEAQQLLFTLPFQEDASVVRCVTTVDHRAKKKRHDIRVTGYHAAIAWIADKCLDAFVFDTGFGVSA